jgi:hypothetical protein
MRSPRFSGSLLLVGYVAIIAGTIAWIIAFETYHQKGFLTSWIAMTVAYGLVGFGCWRSVRACRDDDAARVIRGLTRWVGAASGAMAIASASQTYDYYKSHSTVAAFGGTIPHYPFQIGGGVAQAVGFLSAGVGLWLASDRRPVATEPVPAPLPAL